MQYNQLFYITLSPNVIQEFDGIEWIQYKLRMRVELYWEAQQWKSSNKIDKDTRKRGMPE